MRNRDHILKKILLVFFIGSPWFSYGKEIPLRHAVKTKVFLTVIDTVPVPAQKAEQKPQPKETTAKAREKIKSVPRSKKQVKPAVVAPLKPPVKVKVIKPKIIKPVTKFIP